MNVCMIIDTILLHCYGRSGWTLSGRIVGADIVELNPDRDIDGITSAIAAKLLKELASKIIISNETSR